MAEETESVVESLSDEITEKAQKTREGWLKASALISALLAVMAAVASLEAAHTANDAMIAQLKASDQWGYYQAKGIKGIVIESENTLLTQMGHPQPEIAKRIQKYKDDQEQAKKDAEEFSEVSRHNMEKHEVFSRAVTLGQVSIALVAIALLTKRRRFVLVSCALGLIGLGFLIQGALMG